MHQPDNRRILIVDDNAAIHQDFKKILAARRGDSSSIQAAEAALFDEPAAPTEIPAALDPFEVDSAMQGQEALQRVLAAQHDHLPYAMAFVDMRMPPGWDGVETIRRLWEADADLQIVVCTAFADYTWPEMVARLGRTDRMLVLKKPFDAIEVCQLATALTEKWNLTMRERRHLQDVVRAEQEARAYAASLETVNHALETSWAKSEAEARSKGEFLARVASDVLAPIDALLERAPKCLPDGSQPAAWNPVELDQFGREAAAFGGALRALLDLSAIESGALVLENALFSPWQLGLDVVERGRQRAGSSAVAIEIARRGNIPDRVGGDAARLRRILDELVDNALRHTASGRVQIDVEARSVESSSQVDLRFTVSDTGPGLTREDYARLFEPFCHVRRGSMPLHAGLGLSLARRLAIAVGGELSCESETGQSARFLLSVPVAQATVAR